MLSNVQLRVFHHACAENLHAGENSTPQSDSATGARARATNDWLTGRLEGIVVFHDAALVKHALLLDRKATRVLHQGFDAQNLEFGVNLECVGGPAMDFPARTGTGQFEACMHEDGFR